MNEREKQIIFTLILVKIIKFIKEIMGEWLGIDHLGRMAEKRLKSPDLTRSIN